MRSEKYGCGMFLKRRAALADLAAGAIPFVNSNALASATPAC